MELVGMEIMRKGALLLLILMFLFVCGTEAFPLGLTSSLWRKGTIPAGRHVKIAQITTPYGDGVAVNTSGYPGAFEFGYEFFGYYNERFFVPPSGRVEVEGYFMYDDVTPHLDRKKLSLYLLRSDLTGYIVNITNVLDYAKGHDPGIWYHQHIVLSDLEPGKEFVLAFGRSDFCDMDRDLQASWAAIDVLACRILKVPSQFSTIQQAVSEALPGDIIEVASGTYYEQIVVDKDNLEIIGETSSATIIDASMENGSGQTAVSVTGRDVLITGFTVLGCPEANGIKVYGDNSIILDCNVMYSNSGICVLADNVEIIRSNVHNNSRGVWMHDNVENCTFYYDSFFNNTINVWYEQLVGSNTWHNGYAGNFWSDYNGTDSNGDGVGDNPYMINGDNIDYYPLMSPYMCGDVNHDGRIDMEDVSFVARRFGIGQTDPLWNPHADVNEDAKIDMEDVAVTARGFGQER